MLSATTATDTDTTAIARIINGTTTSDWEAVGMVGSSTEGYYGSGVLIGSKYVLTAGHCAYYPDDGINVGDTEGRFYINGKTYTTSDVIVYDNWNPDQLGTDDANDLAIFVLSEEVTGITPSEIYTGTPEVGDALTLVGYGYSGTGSTGYQTGTYGTERQGTTTIDYVSETLVGWYYDRGSSESNTAPGDSGGPAYIYENGSYYVAGICSCGTGNSGYGTYSYDTRVDAYADWINSIVGEDNSTLPTVSIKATDASAAETLSGAAADTGLFTITLSEAAATDLTVYYTVSGTATNDTDYTSITSSATIAAGSTSTTITVTPIDDAAAEATETVVLTLSSSADYSVSSSLKSATVSILDNEPTVSIVATDATAAETASGATANTGLFTISRTGSTDSDLTVSYTIAGTATNGTDYTAITTTATIAAGSSSTTVQIKPLDDTTAESTETVRLALASSAAYSISSTQPAATVSISDNDTPPTVSLVATDATAAETVSGATANTGLFTLSRTGSTDGDLTVTYIVSGTATNGTDYTAIAQTATIPAGSSSTTIEIKPLDDSAYEGAETVKLTLSASSSYAVSSSKRTATVVIADNDTRPTVGIVATDATAAETASGATANTGLFTIIRTGSADAALTVTYAITGTATNGADYTTIAKTATIPAGSSSTTIEIKPVDDSTYESTETVILTLASSTSYTVSSSQKTATVSITDNDTSSAPANDNFANRISVSAGTVTGSNVGATRESGEPYNANVTGGKSVWWSWTATSSGTVTISTAGSSFDTTLGVYTGTSVSSLTKVAANDDANRRAGIVTSQVSFYAVAGKTYQISVDGYRGASGNIQLALSQTVRSTYSAFSTAALKNTAATDAVYGSLAQLSMLY